MPVTVGPGSSTPPGTTAGTNRPQTSTTTIPSFGTMPSFPTTPAPLSASDIASFAARNAGASRRFADAIARRNAGVGRSKAEYELASKRLDRDQVKAKRTLANTLASRGQAFQPRFMGRGLVDLRDDFADARAQARAGLADKVNSLSTAARTAELEMHETQAATARDRARRQSRLDELIRPLAGS